MTDVPFINVYNDNGAYKYIYNGTVVKVSQIQFDEIKQVTCMTDDQIHTNAYIMFTRHHPIEEVIAVQEFVDMIKRGDVDATELDEKVS